jgi:hypothetical protein
MYGCQSGTTMSYSAWQTGPKALLLVSVTCHPLPSCRRRPRVWTASPCTLPMLPLSFSAPTTSGCLPMRCLLMHNLLALLARAILFNIFWKAAVADSKICLGPVPPIASRLRHVLPGRLFWGSEVRVGRGRLRQYPAERFRQRHLPGRAVHHLLGCCVSGRLLPLDLKRTLWLLWGCAERLGFRVLVSGLLLSQVVQYWG